MGDFFEQLVETAADALLVVDAEGTIVLVNAQAERAFGYARDELVGKCIDLLVPEALRAVHPQHRRAFGANPRPRPMGANRDLFALHKSGSVFPVEISLAPLHTQRGDFVSASVRDISERVKLDAQVRALAAIVEASDDAIIGKTLQGVVTSWNGGAARLFGYEPDEMIGEPLARLIPPDRQDEEKEILDHLSHGKVERFDTVRVRKDGRMIHVSVTSSPIRDARGDLIGAAKVVRDITERRRAEEAVARAKDEAVAANRELEAFSYSVAHDLRAPLRGMKGFARALGEKYGARFDEEGRDWLEEIASNAVKMGALIDALLALARVAQSAVRRESVDLVSVAREVHARLAASDPSRVVELVTADSIEVDADPTLLRAMLDNLLSNAWKFTSKTANARIEVGVSADDASTYFVRDNGSGFDMAFSKKLFVPFQRLHTVDEFPGTGIGLATVQRIVHRHGGRIWAEGSVDHGATFYFTFPKSPIT